MRETITKNAIMNEAGLLGAALGIIPVATQLAGSLFSEAGAFISTLMSFILWAVKFGGCIYLMRWWMLRLCNNYENVAGKDTKRLGNTAALLSALIVAAWTLADFSFFHHETYIQSVDAVISSYSSMLDSNSLSAMESVKGNMGIIGFFSNFIYCWLYGLILSAILSSRIPSRNPFADVNTKTDNE